MAGNADAGAGAQGGPVGDAQGAAPSPGSGQIGEAESFDKDRALETIRRQRESEADTKRQLAEERRQREAYERELNELRATTQSESERAVAKARRDGAAEATTRFHDQLRRAGVRTALISAGVNPEVLDLAAKDDVFSALSVSDGGDVEGVEPAVALLKKNRPSLFSKTTGDFGGGNRGSTPPAQPTMNELLRAAIKGN